MADTARTSVPRTDATAAPASPAHPLARLYLVRALAALLWAALLVLAAPTAGPQQIALLVLYPLLDAAAVAWQVRADRRAGGGRSERVNVVVSLVVALALGVAASLSPAAALVVWGLWAIGAGVPQLITAIARRREGGQVAQMLSGGISVLAGASFAAQGLRGGDTVTGVAGYAVLGAVFFLVSALRLHLLGRRPSA